MKMEKGEITTVLRENLGTEEIVATDLEQVVVPSGGVTTWTIPTIDGDVETKEIIGIIVCTQIIKAYWKESFDDTGGGIPPDCSSEDGLSGIGDPGGNCLKCKFGGKDAFGTAKDGKGRGKACQEGRLIFIVLQDEILPIRIKAPSMSLSTSRKYLFGLTSKRKAVHSVYTSMTLESDKNRDGIKYSKIIFTKIGDIENPAKTEAYAKALKPYLSKVAAEMVKEPQQD